MSAETIGIIGAGPIGVSWSRLFAQCGHPVRLTDTSASVLAEAAAALAGLEVTVQRQLDASVVHSRFVFECVPERVELKRELCRQLDPLLPPTSIFVSSSSALPVSAFTEVCGFQDRALIAHPFNPPHLVPVVELVPAPGTAQWAVNATRDLLVACGKRPVTLHRETIGFAGNRLALALYREAVSLVAGGVISAADLEVLVTDGLALRWAAAGPSETYELNQSDSFSEYFSRVERHLGEVVGALENSPTLDAEGLRLIAENQASNSVPLPIRRACRDQIIGAILDLRTARTVSKEKIPG